MKPGARKIAGVLVWVIMGLTVLASGSLAQDGNTGEGLILSVARAQQLAEQTLEETVAPLGTLLSQIGPSSVFAAGDQGFGTWSVAIGGAATKFSVSSPDYTLEDPAGEDKIEGGAGAVYLDASLGLFRGYQPSQSVTTSGSVDLLLRLGYSLGDQENLAEKVDLSSYAPIYGGGLRFGLLKGPGLPSISLTTGANFFKRRVFSTTIENEDAQVELDFDQTSTFLLLEIGQSFGWITPYLVGGVTHHRMQADYVADVLYGSDEQSTATIDDSVDIKQTLNMFYGGLEFGSGILRLDLEGGVSDGDPFARFFLRFSG